MSLNITNATKNALLDPNIQPNIVFKIDGIDLIFGANDTKEYILIGDDGLYVDGSWYVGGLKSLTNNKEYIDSGTTTYTIQQQINYDEGNGSSISTMTIGLVDKNEEITKIITPGEYVDDILGRKATVYLGFGDTSFSNDYIEIFKGFITDIESSAGVISFKINHPDNKKKISLFKNYTSKIPAAIASSSLTTITVDDTSTLKSPISGALGAYVKINNEIMSYTIASSTTLNVVRGQLGTTATTHAIDSEITSIYSLIGNPIDIALRLMLSGETYNYTDIPIESFVVNPFGSGTITNIIYFKEIDIENDYGIMVGDTVTVTGASEVANNITSRDVIDIVSETGGSFIVVSGSDLVYEINSSAVMSFVSKYNVFDDGMSISPDEVDIEQHEFIRDFFQPSTEFRILVKEDISDGKKFMDDELYKPIACYSLPRKARCSVGYSIGPVPGAAIKTLNINNITNPKNISIQRTTSRAFFNEVLYKYDESPVSDKFLKGYLAISETSKVRIKGSGRTYTIESKGIQSDLNGSNIVEAESLRILDRYKFAAETISLNMLMSESIEVEIGDIVVLEGDNLHISDITNGSRSFSPRLFEVRNKTINLKTGEIDLELLDTSINISTRYGLMSPSSRVASVISQSKIVIGTMSGYTSTYDYLNEWRDWSEIYSLQNGISAIIRKSDYSQSESVIITDISTNTFTLSANAVMTLEAGMIIEFDEYNNLTDKQVLVYCAMNDSVFDDTKSQYSMI